LKNEKHRLFLRLLCHNGRFSKGKFMNHSLKTAPMENTQIVQIGKRIINDDLGGI
tara:strand:- start:1394 stop:1558 length:165 start_codon:yes stop_codon:yes gene_type:complete